MYLSATTTTTNNPLTPVTNALSQVPQPVWIVGGAVLGLLLLSRMLTPSKRPSSRSRAPRKRAGTEAPAVYIQ